MTEGVKPSAAEEARAAALAAEQRKAKPVQNVAEQYGAKAAGTGRPDKKLSTSFDDILKNASEENANLLPSEQKFDSRLKEITQDEDRSSSDEGKEKDKDDDKSADKTSAGKKTKESSLPADERVLGKRSSGEGRQGSEGDGKREGGSQRGFQRDSAAEQAFTKNLMRKDNAPMPAPAEMPKIQPTPVIPLESAEAPRELPKALLDQIVQCVSIKKNGELNQEIQIDFHDKIFNGLKLKLTAQGKEISVEFLVPNRTVEDCFKRERENIALALGEKGIDVRAINVTRG